MSSIALVLDNSGNLIQKMSYDAWGLRRFPDSSEDPTDSINAPDARGYTDHEHLPNSRLINMNARLYDPELGRFISADPFIPNPLRSQAYNRYSYVYNNPLRYSDPTGYGPCVNVNDCFDDIPEIHALPPVLPPGYDYGPGDWFIWEWADIYYDHIAADYVIGGGFVDGGSPNAGSSISSDNIAQSNYSIIQPSLRIQGSEPAPVEEIVVIYKVPDRPRPFRVFSYLSDSEFWHNTAMIVLPGYDLYHCLADGGCGAADYGVAVLGAIPIPGAKAASVGVKGVTRRATRAPDFIVSPGGTTFPVPKGAAGPTPVVNPAGNQTGVAFTGGAGGANEQVSTMRIMNRTQARGNSPGYPNGYIKYENSAFPRPQGVDPYSGKTVPNSQSHFPID